MTIAQPASREQLANGVTLLTLSDLIRLLEGNPLDANAQNVVWRLLQATQIAATSSGFGPEYRENFVKTLGEQEAGELIALSNDVFGKFQNAVKMGSEAGFSFDQQDGGARLTELLIKLREKARGERYYFPFPGMNIPERTRSCF